MSTSIAAIADLLVEGYSFDSIVESCCASCVIGGPCEGVEEDGIRPRTRPWNLTQSKNMDPDDDDGTVNPDDPDAEDDDDDDA
jgi:hypothetical protein